MTAIADAIGCELCARPITPDAKAGQPGCPRNDSENLKVPLNPREGLLRARNRKRRPAQKDCYYVSGLGEMRFSRLQSSDEPQA